MFDIHKMQIIASLWILSQIIPKHKWPPIIPVAEKPKQDISSQQIVWKNNSGLLFPKSLT